MGISEQSTLLYEQKLLTSRHIFRYAVPARTVTKKALVVNCELYCNNDELWQPQYTHVEITMCCYQPSQDEPHTVFMSHRETDDICTEYLH